MDLSGLDKRNFTFVQLPIFEVYVQFTGTLYYDAEHIIIIPVGIMNCILDL